ncbi:peptide/nickel transport system permease protein [Labedella gwakjiensis]|uniref:ABC transporter permease n=1 Tax=Labedella gwakjiensis TaxID=390269 RepID=A0A2P8GUX9_9MICO|nr:ABC transporter permease [Labedella gwakjiensis]PSL37770.1 peptide/nickel transport system permease protein [Labedella gwakjiensis]RUQ87646.1 ABC transporter permease [Labedella gwakjiensis]
MITDPRTTSASALTPTPGAPTPSGPAATGSPAGEGGRFVRRRLLSRMPLRSRVALGAVSLIALGVVLAPVLPFADPYAADLGSRLLGFGQDGHLLGTDSQGRDLLSRLVYGTRTSLVAGVVPILIATAIGLAIGITAGFSGRVANLLLMRFVDILFAFPGVLLALLLALTLGNGLGTLILALTAVWIAPVARIAETEVARVKELDFVTAARSSGAGLVPILWKQILPVALPAVVAYSTSLVGANVAIAGGLGFIGLGVPSPQAELGSILQEMQAAVYTNPSLALAPVIVILALSVMFPLVGDGIRDAIAGRGRES